MKKYKVHHPSNFSIGDQEFYLTIECEVELPDHELVESMCARGYLTLVPENTENKKTSNVKK